MRCFHTVLFLFYSNFRRFDGILKGSLNYETNWLCIHLVRCSACRCVDRLSLAFLLFIVCWHFCWMHFIAQLCCIRIDAYCHYSSFTAVPRANAHKLIKSLTTSHISYLLASRRQPSAPITNKDNFQNRAAQSKQRLNNWTASNIDENILCTKFDSFFCKFDRFNELIFVYLFKLKISANVHSSNGVYGRHKIYTKTKLLDRR